MIPALLVILAIAFGCATIVLSVAFEIAAKDHRDEVSYGLLIGATGAMALSVSIATLAGRFL